MTDPETIVGSIAAVITTVAFLPQVVKVWRSRSAGDLSLPTFVLFTVGVTLWLIYGVLLRNPVIIAPNVVTLALAGSVLFLALKYRREERQRDSVAARGGVPTSREVASSGGGVRSQ